MDSDHQLRARPWRRARSLAQFSILPTLAALLLGGCGDEGAAATASGRGPGGSGGPPGDRRTPVEVAVVERGAVARSATLTGAVEPLRQVGVNAQLGGVLTAVLVEEGDQVEQGQVLARLDDRELSAQVRAAEAQVELAESTFRRSEQLRAAQVVTEAEYERDRANLEAARAQLDQLRTRLGFTTIRAPISGVVTERRLMTGDVAAPQARLFSIANLDQLVVRLPVSELDVGELQVGQRVNLQMDALPNRTFVGRIRRIFPTADTTTRLVPVEVLLEGEGARRARPGYLARVTFQLGARDDVLRVPARAVIGGAGAEAVFVVEDAVAHRRPVITGLRQGDHVEIVSGLSDGESVIVAGHTTLRDGAAVRVINPNADTRQAAADSVTPVTAPAPNGARP